MIKSEDPKAIDKLREQLEKLEDRRAQIKADNKILRRAKIDPKNVGAVERLKDAGVSERALADLPQLFRVCPYHCEPFYKYPSYELTNIGTNVNRIKRRIEELERLRDSQPPGVIEGSGFRIVEDSDWHRILILFDSKPSAEIRTYLKSRGWRWAPSRTAWICNLSEAGRICARKAAEIINEITTDSTVEA